MKKIMALLFIFFTISTPLTTFATDREFFIPEVNVDATINDDGTVDVVEKIAYDFKGDYNGILRNINAEYNNTLFLKKVKIIDKNGKEIIAKEEYSGSENTYEINNNGSTGIKLYTKSSNEGKVIEISYRLKDVISLNEAEGNLNWNFYTVENVEKVDKATLRVGFNGKILDEVNSRYNTYSDGELATSYENGKIKIEVKNLTSILAVNLSIPSTYLNNYSPTVHPSTDGNINSGIIDENRIELDNKPESASGILVGMLVLGAIGVLVAIIRSKSKTEEEITKYRESESYFTEDFYHSMPENIPPALVSFLIKDGWVHRETLSLSLFYLAHTGYYKIEEIKIKKAKDLKFTRNIEMGYPKEAHLAFVIDTFKSFEVDGEFTLAGITKAMKKENKAIKFNEALNNWESKVLEDAKALNMVTIIRGKTILTNYYDNERKKWVKYRKYVENLIDNEMSDEILKESTSLLIYAKALDVSYKKIDLLNDKLMDFVKDLDLNGVNSSRINNPYYNNYFIYLPLYNVLYSGMETSFRSNDNSPVSSFTGGGFSGGGGGFSGGGGGGSGAF